MGFEFYDLDVNGIKVSAKYNTETVKNVFVPLIEKFTEIYKKKKGKVLVFLAAAPGVGKTTLSLFLEKLSKETGGVMDIQCIGLDGFHYHQEYLLSHRGFVYGEDTVLAKVKGSAETFDLEKLKKKISSVLSGKETLWPIYDRKNLHDVVEDVVPVTGDIVLIEGNWLLLKDEGWCDLIDLCDYSIYIDAKEEFLKGRLIGRKISGGSTPEEAAQFYERADGKNVRRVLSDSQAADLTLVLQENGDYKVKEI